MDTEDHIGPVEGEFPEEQAVDTTATEEEVQHRTLQLSGMYESWFLDYASYVILERAVPEALDGLKPVQRRILHAMREMDDGRFHKVANIIGQTMQYHPHGDASIGDALVQLGQKDLLIDTQGNWGNILTGDSAAAPRYIEARLSRFALDVVFNPKITRWKQSYDGRKKEPVILPVKFPLLLAMGVEGIAVGLASKILPHNFVELIDAAIALLRDEPFTLYPDFITGGFIDVTRYNEGLRGGKIRLRARIQQLDKKTLVIREIPFFTTTGALIDTILAANEKGKIRIRKIDDNTAENVEVIIHLAPGVSPDQTIDALYAFTDCEMSISPNTCVIHDGKPRFLGVSELLNLSVDHTVDLLGRELEIRLDELDEQWHFSSLERLFIEHRIYRRIEKSETWEDVLSTIEKGLEPYLGELKREVTRDDIIRLTEIKIKRISRYDADRAADTLLRIEAEMQEVKYKLDHLVDHAIQWFNGLREKYGKGRERRTEIRSFEVIEATMVAAANHKLYVNREEGFAGTGLRKDEYVCDCSDIDDIIAIRGDGTFVVTRVAEKVFVGKDILHIDVFRKNDDRTIYNLIYQDGKGGPAMVKRFAITGVTRDKEYDLTAGTRGSRVLYLTANANGEAELLHVMLRPRPRMKKTAFDFDFSEVSIRSRSAKGNILTKNIIRKITQKEEGISTLDAMGIWYDDTVNRINSEGRGTWLGKFKGEDRIMGFNRSGSYRTYGFDLTTHFSEDIEHIRKFDPASPVTLVYFDGATNDYYLKRFLPDDTEKVVMLISDHPDSRVVLFSFHPEPLLNLRGLKRTKAQDPVEEEVRAAELIAVKGITAKGKKLAAYMVTEVAEIPQAEPEPSIESTNEEEHPKADATQDELPVETNSPLAAQEPADLQPDDNPEEEMPEEAHTEPSPTDFDESDAEASTGDTAQPDEPLSEGQDIPSPKLDKSRERRSKKAKDDIPPPPQMTLF